MPRQILVFIVLLLGSRSINSLAFELSSVTAGATADDNEAY
jgi:hypothetical protein